VAGPPVLNRVAKAQQTVEKLPWAARRRLAVQHQEAEEWQVVEPAQCRRAAHLPQQQGERHPRVGQRLQAERRPKVAQAAQPRRQL